MNTLRGGEGMLNDEHTAHPGNATVRQLGTHAAKQDSSMVVSRVGSAGWQPPESAHDVGDMCQPATLTDTNTEQEVGGLQRWLTDSQTCASRQH